MTRNDDARGGERAPLVTTIIPSYDHARYVGNAIESVLAQDYPNVELIVIDDGSSDGSHDVIRAYAHDPRVTAILNTENRGQSFVFNRALEASTGAFVQLLPSDDWYLPHKTRLQVERFLASDAQTGVVYARGRRFFEDTGETHDVRYPVTPPFRREVFDVAPMDETLRAEGEAVYVRIALHYEFAHVDEFVAVMRDHSYNVGASTHLMYDEAERCWAKFFARPDIPEHIRALEPVPMRRPHRTKGMQFIGEERDFAMGRRA